MRGQRLGESSRASFSRTSNSPERMRSQCIPCSGFVTAGRVFFDASIDFVARRGVTSEWSMPCQ